MIQNKEGLRKELIGKYQMLIENKEHNALSRLPTQMDMRMRMG